LSQDVSLDTHIADVVNLLIWEDLRNIVLVGHSYGGAVVRHVADQLPDRCRVGGQCTMQPLASLEAEAHLNGNCDTVATIGYILASGWEDSPFLQFYGLAGGRRWWRADLACGHDAMLDAPDELAALLLQRR
jgi:pimeloyl-ACP methyl ester carboxylesterase